MLFNKQRETESQKQPTQWTTHGRTSPDHGTIQVPITRLHNYEKLDHESLRKLCETDWRKHVDCIMCDRPQNETYRCKGCRSARYCSWECKVNDQPHHDLVCAQWANFQKPASRTAGRMLIFPAQCITPVFAWADLIRAPDEDSPLLTFTHPETQPFIDSFTGTTPLSKLARMGCINECRAIARSKDGLGHGLFVLEWTPTPQTSIYTTWINRSIQGITGLPAGQTWLWTGPVAIIALDMASTDAKAHQYTLSNTTLRDFRHAVDFFTLNLRNAAIPPPFPFPVTPTTLTRPLPPTISSQTTTTLLPTTNLSTRTTPSTTSSRSPLSPPFRPFPALKLNEPHTPLAHIQGITLPLEEVHVSRHLPRTARTYEGVSAVCAALGLAWVVRAVLIHGEELDWVFWSGAAFGVPASGGGGGGGDAAGFGGGLGAGNGDGLFEDGDEDGDRLSEDGDGDGSASSQAGSSEVASLASASSPCRSEPSSQPESAAACKGRGRDGTAGQGRTIPTQLDLAFALDEGTGRVEGTRFPQTGDGLVLMHAGGERLRKEHVQALVAFIKKGGVDGKYKLADEELEKEFRKFWNQFKANEKVPIDVPSPYDMTPTLSGVKSGDRFLLCREVFKQLVPRARPEVRVFADGWCVRR